MAEVSKGVANTGLGLGIAGTVLGLANGGLNNLLGNLGLGANNGTNLLSDMLGISMLSGLFSGNVKGCGCSCGCGCNEVIGATRYDLGIMNQLSQKDATIARLEVSQETDKKILDLYRYIDGKDKATGEAIAQIAAAQAVTNQKVVDDMRFIQADLNNKIAAEKNARCCADNAIVTYSNATFYAKLVADVTAGTETTAQATYNPIPNCGCCGCGTQTA